jgi:hypothetical protein
VEQMECVRRRESTCELRVERAAPRQAEELGEPP